MKNQIVEIIEGSIDPWGERDANAIAEEILDLPVKGLKVEMKWSNIVSDDIGLKQKRPLTVGEALEMFVQVIGSNYLLTGLTTKDGGRIVREEE